MHALHASAVGSGQASRSKAFNIDMHAKLCCCKCRLPVGPTEHIRSLWLPVHIKMPGICTRCMILYFIWQHQVAASFLRPLCTWLSQELAEHRHCVIISLMLSELLKMFRQCVWTLRLRQKFDNHTIHHVVHSVSRSLRQLCSMYIKLHTLHPA